MNKHNLYNGLILTTDDINIMEPMNKYIHSIVGYKPFYVLNTSVDILCPMYYIFKANDFFFEHSFIKSNKMKEYISQAKESVTKLSDNGIKLEPWEQSWVTLHDSLDDKEATYKAFLNMDSKDILSFFFAYVYGLYNGNKDFLGQVAQKFVLNKENHSDPYFIGIYSFILQELKQFDLSEKWVMKGLELEPNAVWTQHVYAHILYAENRLDESITYLEQRRDTWRQNSSNFIYKHINWHLALCHLEKGSYDKAYDIIDHVASFDFEGAECPLSLLGYVLRVFLRSEEHWENFISSSWVDKVLSYASNLKIYTSHLLFDILTVWLITKKQGESKLLTEVISKVKENVDSVPEGGYKDYLRTVYLTLIDAMIMFAREDYKSSYDKLLKVEDQIVKVGASDEQMFVLYEMLLFCSYKCSDEYNFNRVIKEQYQPSLFQLPYVEKWTKQFTRSNEIPNKP